MASQERRSGQTGFMKMIESAREGMSRGRRDSDPLLNELVNQNSRLRLLEEEESQQAAHVKALKASFAEWANGKFYTEPVYFERPSRRRVSGSAERIRMTESGRVDRDYVQVAIPFYLDQAYGKKRLVPACNTPELFEIDQEIFTVKGGLPKIPVLVLQARRSFPMSDSVTQDANKLADGRSDVSLGGGAISVFLYSDQYEFADPTSALLYRWDISSPRPLVFPDGTVIKPRDITPAGIADFLIAITRDASESRLTGAVNIDVEHMDKAIAMLGDQCAWIKDKWDKLIMPATVRQAFTDHVPAVVMTIASQFELSASAISALYKLFSDGKIQSEAQLVAIMSKIPGLVPKPTSTIARVFAEKGVNPNTIPSTMILAHILPSMIYVNVKAWPLIEDLMKKVEAAQTMARAAELQAEIQRQLIIGEIGTTTANAYRDMSQQIVEQIRGTVERKVRGDIADSAVTRRYLEKYTPRPEEDDESPDFSK